MLCPSQRVKEGVQELVEEQVQVPELLDQGLVGVLQQLPLLLVVDVWRLHGVLRIFL